MPRRAPDEVGREPFSLDNEQICSTFKDSHAGLLALAQSTVEKKNRQNGTLAVAWRRYAADAPVRGDTRVHAARRVAARWGLRASAARAARQRAGCALE